MVGIAGNRFRGQPVIVIVAIDHVAPARLCYRGAIPRRAQRVSVAGQRLACRACRRTGGHAGLLEAVQGIENVAGL